jgi:hypothetical protein
MSGNNGLNLPTEIPGLGGGSDLEGLSDFAKGILGQIPEEDRSTVAKYYKEWDGNVTKRFQDVHEQYKPYKELGEPDQIKEALEWIELLNSDPVSFIKNVQEAMKEAGIEMTQQEINDELSNLPEYEGLPKTFLDQFQKQQAELAELRESLQGFTQTTQEKEEQAALDNLLGTLHNTHGEFDDDWVLLQIAKGIDPDEAVTKFNTEFVAKYSSQQTRKPAPNLFTGAAGSVPNGQVDMSKMSKADKMAMAVEALKAANNQG